jgi:hypothetical protein
MEAPADWQPEWGPGCPGWGIGPGTAWGPHWDSNEYYGPGYGPGWLTWWWWGPRTWWKPATPYGPLHGHRIVEGVAPYSSAGMVSSNENSAVNHMPLY